MRTRNPLVFWVALLLELYKLFISPILPPSCRFYPSCSEYSLQAFRRYGFSRGLWLSLKRISRCHPQSAGGYDPVN
ncbi:MAG TPA: membrane protein insertion efficiency factor YidD [Thermodesulfobacteriota bacterium]|nr:membrane protein insertion efficiency factor YidD [Thermodesulfobacteriota bacterium]